MKKAGSRMAPRLFLTVCGGLALCISAQAGTILTENFNELATQLSATSVGVFTAIGGTNVDIVGDPAFPGLCVAPEGNQCVDMGGTGGNNVGILQSAPITLLPGFNYFLSFDLIGSQRILPGNPITTSTTVTFGSFNRTFVLAATDITAGVVSNALISVSSPTVTNLTFTNNGSTNNNVGALLDNVTIAVTTPEPSFVMLMGPALLGLGLLRRRLVARR
jgi:hypothetical protein